MKTLEQLKEERKKRKEESATTGTSNVQESSTPDSLETLKAKRRFSKLYESYTKETDSLAKDVKSRYFDSDGNYIEQYRHDYDEWKSSAVQRSSSLQSQAAEMKTLLEKYGKYYDKDFVSQLSSAIESNDEYFRNVAKGAISEYDLYSQGEDKYKAYKNTDKYQDFSYDELQDEINNLSAKGANDPETSKTIDWLETYIHSKDYGSTANYDEIIGGIDERIDFLKQENARLGAELTDFNNPDVSDEIEKVRKEWKTLEDRKKTLVANRRQAALREKKEPLEKEAMAMPDFDTKSQYAPTAPKTDAELEAEGYKKDAEGKWYKEDGWAHRYTYSGEDDELYTYINDPESRLGVETTNTWNGYNHYQGEGYDQLKEDEISVYNSLYATDKSKADEYMELLKPTLQMRAMNKEAERYAEAAEAIPVIMSAVSLGTNFQNALMFPGKVVATATGTYDENPWLDMYGNRTNAIRGTVGNMLDENVGHLASMAYSGVMSMGDMGVALAAGGGNGKLVQAIMSSSAGSSTISNAKAQGRSDGEALIRGLGSAAIEWATEKYSIEKLLTDPSSIGSYLVQNFYTEAMEEGASNLGNIALDGLSSYLFNSKSEIESTVDDLVLNGGLSKYEAGKKVLLQKANEFFEDMAVGGFTGFGMGGITLGTGVVGIAMDDAARSKQAGIDITDNNRVAELAALATNTGNAKLKKLAEEVAGVKYDNLSTAEKNAYTKKVGKLYSKTNKAQQKKLNSVETDTLKSIVSEKLKANGVEDSKIDKASDAIVKQITNIDKALSASEKKIFDEVNGTEIYNEIIKDNGGEVQTEVRKAQQQRLLQNVETMSLTNEKAKAKTIDTSDYSLSDDGKTYIKSTGEEVTITGVSSINKGKMMVNLSNGKTENIHNLDLGSQDDAIIYQGILDMGVDASIGQKIVKSYKSTGLDANTYILGVRDAIRYGKIGGKAFLNEGTFVTELPEKMREEFYNIGDKYTTEAVKRKTEAQKVKGFKGAKGTVTFKGVDRNNLNSRQKASVNAIEATISGVMGINVVFFNSPVNDKGVHIGKNGSYNASTNTIELDVSAGINGTDVILFTAAHELTHYIAEWSPDKFKTFADFLVKQYHAHGVDIEALIQKKMDSFGYDYDRAFEEVVADSCESFLRDSNLMKTLTALAKQDMTLFEKIKSYIDTLLERINKEYAGLTPDSREGREVLKMKDAIEELHDLWDEAALSAMENSQNAGSKTEGSSSIKNNIDIKPSLREIVGTSGTHYGKGVYLDSTLLDNLSEKERIEMVKLYLDELGGNTFPAHDADNNVVNIRIAKADEKFRNKNGKLVPVYKHLKGYLKNDVKQEAIALIDEVITVSTYDESNATNYPHDWLDNNGKNDWEYWTVYLQEKNNSVWEATLNIANTANGEKVLYEIFPIKMVEQPVKPGTSTTEHNISQSSQESQEKYSEMNYERSTDIGAKSLADYANAKTTDGKELFQYRAMENDEDAYRVMLHEHTDMTDTEIDNLFTTIDKAVEIIKNNLEILDYAWEEDIDDRAFNPVKLNSDKLYKFSVDFSTMCRKRILQQVIIEELQSALDRAVTKAESIAIRNELMKLQEQGRQIEIACALCYVESARMKSPAQIQKFLDDRANVVRNYFATKSTGEIKEKIAKAEADTRKRLAKQYAEEIAKGEMPDPTEIVGKKTKNYVSLKSLPKKMADEIRLAKKTVAEGYKPDANEAKLIKVAESLSVEDFTSAKGLENLAKNYPEIFDAYTSYVRNATKSKGTEKDVWWRIGDSQKLTDDLIATMNAENGLRSQSWSDFQVMHLLDYIGAIIELSARKAKMQVYTKVPDYVLLMGNTNQMINLSLIPVSEFNGKLDFDSVEGMEFKRALELRDTYHATAGTISIGINDEQIRMLLDSGLIDYVIPYHQSGMAKVVRKEMHIPTWESYESYQSEKTLKTEVAKKNAKAYGVKLLPNKDPMWHKSPKFSEWFDVEEARQIAEMENHTPSDPKTQKKYGVMYGAYKAMQNAANNYLKMCVERGLSPKFSHEKADFTNEANYWKLLIDRKMIDNVTGEIIEQKPVQAVFNESDVLGILNDELARYGKIKEDQDYATRTVVSKFLSGDMSEDVSKIAASILEKPVNNVTVPSILNSASEVKNSERVTPEEDAAYMEAYFDGDEDLMQELVDKVAYRLGYKYKAYHHTENGFTVFDLNKARANMDIQGFFFSADKDAESEYGSVRYDTYLKMDNPYIVDSAEKQKAIPFDMSKDNAGVIAREWLQSQGYDSVIRKAEYYGAEADEYIVFEASQIKSSEPMTFADDEYGEGDVIPLSERFDQLNDDIRYQMRDTEYLDAVNRGDTETVQRMVDEAAKEAGYSTKVFHGTTGFGFTQIDVSKSDDGMSFFATDSVETAGTYSGTEKVKRVSELSTQTDDDRDEIINSIHDISRDLAEHCNRTLGIQGWVDYNYFKSKIDDCVHDLEYGVKPSDVKQDFLDFCDELFYSFEDNYYEGNYVDNPSNDEEMSFDAFQESAECEELADEFYEYVYTITGTFDTLDFDANTGIYDMHANTDGLFEIDAQGKRWNAIPFDQYDPAGLHPVVNTRQVARYAKNEGYKGVKITNVFDDGGRSAKHQTKPATVYIFFDPQIQVKSADPITYDDNGNVIPLSERFNRENKDIRYQERDTEAIEAYKKVVETLEKENAKLTNDVASLKELVKLQRTETHGKRYTQSSIDVVAKNLMKKANAKGDREELRKILEDVYSYILQGEDVSWDGIVERAEGAVDWLMKHEYVETARDEYANTILKDLRKTRFYLDDLQKKEVAYRYGSYNEFRKKTMGRFILTDKANMSLDSLWQSLANDYPGTFDAETTSNDQPLALMDIIDGLQEEVPVEYYGDEQMSRQELLMDVYEGYWEVSTLTTFADKKQKEINLLKHNHKEQMTKLRESHKDKAAQLKKEYNERLAKVRERSYEKQESIAKHYQEARKKGIENRSKTEVRRKIKGVVNDLDNILMHGNKDRNVKEDMQDVALAMLKSADAVFSTSYSNKKIAQGDISQMILTEDEKNKVETYKSILDSITKTKAKIKALNEEGTSDAKLLNKLYSNLNNYENSAKYYDNMLEDVFERERIRISKVTVPQALSELTNAYKSIQKSKYAYISNVYNAELAERLDELSKDESMNRPFKEMSLEQLGEIYDAYKMVLTSIRDANKLFAFDKDITVEKLGTNARSEIEKIRTTTKSNPALDFVRRQGWNTLKPIYAFRTIGSDTLTKLYENIRKGEDVWYGDVSEAKAYREEMKQKYGYKAWDLEETYHFVSNNGKKFSLTLEQIMSLYALSRRDQSYEHLMQGGIVLDDAVEVKDEKTGKTYKVNTANTFTFNPELLNEVTKVVRENENLRGYVESMQEYLTKMGDKGNEVSMKLFGVRLFKEKVYFPIKSSDTYMNFKPEEVGEFKIKNSSFTNATKKFANNPIVLSDFDSIWGGHINDMSLYHAFTLPLEDFTRVFNYRTHVDGELGQDAVRGTLRNAYGDGAEKYIRNLLKDLNGGVRSQQGTEISNKLISLGKKASVFASASVTVQQPSAIARAFAHINPKYFANVKQFDLKHHNEAWEELKMYAPVAGIKEMGYFDTGLGQSSVDWIIQDNPDNIREGVKAFFSKDSAYRDEILSKAPALADEISWIAIWEAVKKEVADNYDKNAEDYLKKCGDRFTEVITLTQVYDSVLSRSGFMRSKDTLVKTAVSFMAEPTTTMNVVYDSFVQNHRKTGRSNPAKVIPAVVTSVLFNAILKALVTAGRDDDEDEAWLEKYLSSAVDSFKDDINPLTYIPYVKDIVSLLAGYDIKRMDMTVIAQLVDSIQDCSKDSVPVYKKITGVIGAASSIFGIPLKNILRDIDGVFNTVKSLGVSPTSYGMGEAFIEGLTGKETTLKERTWNAYKKGDTSTVKKTVNGLITDKVKSGKTEKEAKSAVRSSFTTTYKKEYLEAVANKDYTLMNEIRKFLHSTGLYGSLTELDKSLKEWRTSK